MIVEQDKNMKKDTLVKGAAVFGALALMAGGMVAADAAINNSAIKNLNTNQAQKSGQGLGLGHERGQGQMMAGLSETERTAKLAEMEANRSVHQAEMTVQRTAVTAAINSNDYNAWVKAVGADSPLAKKVTAANFAKFSEAHKLMEQARAIFTDLGLDNGIEGHGLGMGMGFGGGRLMNK